MGMYGGHRSKDRHKSSFANRNAYAWDANGKLLGRIIYGKDGKMKIVKIKKVRKKKF